MIKPIKLMIVASTEPSLGKDSTIPKIRFKYTRNPFRLISCNRRTCTAICGIIIAITNIRTIPERIFTSQTNLELELTKINPINIDMIAILTSVGTQYSFRVEYPLKSK